MTLVAKNIQKKIGDKTIVSDLSFEVCPGEIVGLLGPNGAGKTTAFYVTMGLASMDSGTILLDTKNISKLTTSQRASLGIGYLSQEPSIFRGMSVEENILCILENVYQEKQKRMEHLDLLLTDFGLSHLAKKNASTLSGGERRRLEIARALARKPSFLLFDEPFAAIDPITIYDVQQMILTLKKDGIGILITDHNARELLSIMDRGYLLFEGKVLCQGTPEELLNDPSMRSIYLGQNFRN